MKKEQIRQLFERYETACYLYNGIECWSARKPQEIFNYTNARFMLGELKKGMFQTASFKTAANVNPALLFN